MIGFRTSGSFKNTEKFFERIRRGDPYRNLNRHGQRGVEALSSATPIDTSHTANSWDYRIVKDRRGVGIEWFNTNNNGTANVAILLQYGHATGTGGYVSGVDYINPALKPIFNEIADDVWKEVRK